MVVVMVEEVMCSSDLLYVRTRCPVPGSLVDCKAFQRVVKSCP